MISFRFTLADKISITIIAVGLIGILLVYYLSTSHKQFAYQHHAQSIQQLAYLEINDLIDSLKTDSQDLALSIEIESDFLHDFQHNDIEKVIQQLDNQFYRYFVTAGVFKLLKVYVFDTTFRLHGSSTKGVTGIKNNSLLCPDLRQRALKRRGSEKMKSLTAICLYENIPVYAVIVPMGGLKPVGYIQIVTDLAHKLKNIEQSLGMPIQINTLDGQLLYESDVWQSLPNNRNYLNIDLPILNENNEPVMTLSFKSDMIEFNKEITQHRNRIMSLALVATALTVFLVLFILRRSAIPPLAKIHDVLEKIHLYSYSDNDDGRLLFESLLEQIILLRRKHKKRFSVMILDLTHFRKINDEYGAATGDQLLVEVELRLGSILRDTDLISWVGTDTPGHKLLPIGRKTQYRATIARLGGDEFGLLLPSAQTAEQAHTVAQRIVDTLGKPFLINDYNITIECKIGISIYPIHGNDEKVLIRNADKAMYQAKSQQQPYLVYTAEKKNENYSPA